MIIIGFVIGIGSLLSLGMVYPVSAMFSEPGSQNNKILLIIAASLLALGPVVILSGFLALRSYWWLILPLCFIVIIGGEFVLLEVVCQGSFTCK